MNEIFSLELIDFNKMIKHFTIVWVLYWAMVLVLPVHSEYSMVFEAFILQLSFFLLVCFGYYWTVIVTKPESSTNWETVDKDILSNLYISVSLVLSIVGTILLIYDKFFIQQINYSDGIAIARSALRIEGEKRIGSYSSFYSLAGYLLSSSYFIAAILIFRTKDKLKDFHKLALILLVFILLMTNSLLVAGRSNVLLLLVLVSATISGLSGWSLNRFISSAILRSFIWMILISGASYAIYVFADRAVASGHEFGTYTISFLPHLGLEMDQWYERWLEDGGKVADVSSLFVLAGSYISHSFSTTAAIIEYASDDKTIMLHHPLNLLSKIGIVDKPDTSWFLTGRFPSLAGALWYKFQFFGFVVISFLIGVLAGFVKFFNLKTPNSLLILCLYTSMYSVLILSPILLSIDFLSFPFVVFSFLSVGILGRLISSYSHKNGAAP